MSVFRSRLVFLVRSLLKQQQKQLLYRPAFERHKYTLCCSHFRNFTTSSIRCVKRLEPDTEENSLDEEDDDGEETSGQTYEFQWMSVILRADKATVNRIIRLYPEVGAVTPNNLKKRFNHLVRKDVPPHLIHLMPWVLTVESGEFFGSR